MSLVGDINDRYFPGLPLQIVHPEIYAVVITIGSAHCHYSPKIACVEAIKRGKKLYHIALKFRRRQCAALLKGVSGVVNQHIPQIIRRIPFIKSIEVAVIIAGVAQSIRSIGQTLLSPFVKFLKS